MKWVSSITCGKKNCFVNWKITIRKYCSRLVNITYFVIDVILPRRKYYMQFFPMDFLIDFLSEAMGNVCIGLVKWAFRSDEATIISWGIFDLNHSRVNISGMLYTNKITYEHITVIVKSILMRPQLLNTEYFVDIF